MSNGQSIRMRSVWGEFIRMIFVTTGSQKFQFNRLLQKIDLLIEEGMIREEVFAQIGVSDYQPKHYEYCRFLDREGFTGKLRECRMVITSLFTDGVAKFDEYYEKGWLDRVITTNLNYRIPELLDRPYYIEANMSKYLASIIDIINHDVSVEKVRSSNEKIMDLMKKVNEEK